jgi:hypothetical protein
MKTYLFIAILLLFKQFLLAQQKTEAYFGVSNRMDYTSSITEMYDKGFYITGGFEYEMGWDIKIDKNLELLYDKVFEHDLGVVGIKGSASDQSGNIYIHGFIEITGNLMWPFISKLDSCGNKVWCKVLQYDNEFGYGSSIDILLTNNNEILLLTDYDSEEEIDKLHIIGLDENGEVMWIKPYASKDDHPWIREPNAYSIKEIDDDYYISGYCYWPYPDDTTHFFLRPFFIGIDSLLEEKWILPFAPLDSIFGDAYDVLAINDSVLLGVGERWLEGYNMNSLFMFFKTNGQEMGYHQITNEDIGSNVSFNAIRKIEAVNDNEFLSPLYVGINFETHFGEITYDTLCSIQNQMIRAIYSGTSSITKTSDGNYVIAIEVDESKSDDIYIYKIDENLNDVPFDPTPHTYDSLCPGGIQSGTIDLTSCFVWTDIGESPSPKEYYSFISTIPIIAYPNPAETEITLAFENTEHHTKMLLECYNIYGQKVHSEKIWKGQQHTKLDVSGWGKGLYFAVVKSNGKVAGTGRFVRR